MSFLYGAVVNLGRPERSRGRGKSRCDALPTSTPTATAAATPAAAAAAATAAADAVAAAHARRLVDAVVRDRTGIDVAIERAAPRWPVVSLARIDRSLLRSAMGELLHCPATPTAVAISEWVELARSYSGESARRLLNGILGRVAREASRQTRPVAVTGGGHDNPTDDQEEPPT